MYLHRVLAPVHHRTLHAEWVCSVNGQLQSGLDLVIATIAILRGRVISSRSPRITYLSEGWHVCRYPGLPSMAVAKATLRGLGISLGIFGTLDSLGRHTINHVPST